MGISVEGSFFVNAPVMISGKTTTVFGVLIAFGDGWDSVFLFFKGRDR